MARFYKKYIKNEVLVLIEISKDDFKQYTGWASPSYEAISEASINIENGVLTLTGNFHTTKLFSEYNIWSSELDTSWYIPKENILIKTTRGIWPFTTSKTFKYLKEGYYRCKEYKKKTIKTSLFRIENPMFPVQII